MARSPRTTEIHVDSSALTRLMEIARETDLYSDRREAREDNYEQVVHHLVDHFDGGGA